MKNYFIPIILFIHLLNAGCDDRKAEKGFEMGDLTKIVSPENEVALPTFPPPLHQQLCLLEDLACLPDSSEFVIHRGKLLQNPAPGPLEKKELIISSVPLENQGNFIFPNYFGERWSYEIKKEAVLAVTENRKLGLIPLTAEAIEKSSRIQSFDLSVLNPEETSKAVTSLKHKKDLFLAVFDHNQLRKILPLADKLKGLLIVQPCVETRLLTEFENLEALSLSVASRPQGEFNFPKLRYLDLLVEPGKSLTAAEVLKSFTFTTSFRTLRIKGEPGKLSRISFPDSLVGFDLQSRSIRRSPLNFSFVGVKLRKLVLKGMTFAPGDLQGLLKRTPRLQFLEIEMPVNEDASAFRLPGSLERFSYSGNISQKLITSIKNLPRLKSLSLIQKFIKKMPVNLGVLKNSEIKDLELSEVNTRKLPRLFQLNSLVIISEQVDAKTWKWIARQKLLRRLYLYTSSMDNWQLPQNQTLEYFRISSPGSELNRPGFATELNNTLSKSCHFLELNLGRINKKTMSVILEHSKLQFLKLFNPDPGSLEVDLPVSFPDLKKLALVNIGKKCRSRIMEQLPRWRKLGSIFLEGEEIAPFYLVQNRQYLSETGDLN
ncbi:MAG: hypothetical protein PF689_00335 [Deltaproteobacteria bacterium]|jgi:Leucine-rich repeat (LRR) protein|nr:hypothetical protein [Deltaproteobacteria bacterium]